MLVQTSPLRKLVRFPFANISMISSNLFKSDGVKHLHNHARYRLNQTWSKQKRFVSSASWRLLLVLLMGICFLCWLTLTLNLFIVNNLTTTSNNNVEINKIDQLSIESLAMHDQHLTFIHIPKTGGTTIENFGHKVLNEDWSFQKVLKQFNIPDKVGHDAYDILVQNQTFLSLSHKIKSLLNINIGDIESIWHIPPKYFLNYLESKHFSNNVIKNVDFFNYYKNINNTFCVVRNPFSRVISEYGYMLWFNNRYNNNNDEYDHECNMENFEKYIQEIYSNFINSRNRGLYSKEQIDCTFGCHKVSQSEFVFWQDKNGKEIQTCHHVLKFEDFNNQFMQLLKVYGYDAKGYTLNNFQPNKMYQEFQDPSKCKNKLNPQTLSQKSLQQIIDMYQHDFKRFNYSSQPYHI